MPDNYEFLEAQWKEMQKRTKIDDRTKEYLQTTRDILVGYDGEHTVEGLKKLVDETRERLEKALHGDIKDEDLSLTEEQFNRKLDDK